MKCNLPKFVKYQLRLGKLPMMDVYEITPSLQLAFVIRTFKIGRNIDSQPRRYTKADGRREPRALFPNYRAREKKFAESTRSTGRVGKDCITIHGADSQIFLSFSFHPKKNFSRERTCNRSTPQLNVLPSKYRRHR